LPYRVVTCWSARAAQRQRAADISAGTDVRVDIREPVPIPPAVQNLEHFFSGKFATK